MGRKPKSGYTALARAARAQLALADSLNASLKQRMKIKREASDMWVPDEDWRRDFASVTNTLQHSGNALTRALAENKKDLGSMTDEQLQAQFQAELINAAQTLSDDDWNKMCAARMKAKAGQ